MMILAEVELRPVGLGQRLADEGGDARVGGGRDRLDRRLTSLPGRGEGGGAHGDDDLRVGRLDRLDRVAGVDRPLEGLRADHLGDVGDLHHVEQRRDARRDVLGGSRSRARRSRRSPERARRSARRAARPAHGRRARRRRRAPWRRPRASRPPRPRRRRYGRRRGRRPAARSRARRSAPGRSCRSRRRWRLRPEEGSP